MTIGLTALVERYLTERRTLGFLLSSTPTACAAWPSTSGAHATAGP